MGFELDGTLFERAWLGLAFAQLCLPVTWSIEPRRAVLEFASRCLAAATLRLDDPYPFVDMSHRYVRRVLATSSHALVTSSDALCY